MASRKQRKPRQPTTIQVDKPAIDAAVDRLLLKGFQERQKQPIHARTFVHEDGKPTQVTDTIVHANGRESIEDHPQRFTDAEKAQPTLALTPEQIAASQERVRKAASAADIEAALEAHAVPEPKHHINQRDGDGKATSPAKEADLAQRKAETTEALRKEVRGWKDDVSDVLVGCVAFVLFIIIVAVGIAGADAVYIALTVWDKIAAYAHQVCAL